MKTIEYYILGIWWHIVAAYHAVNADLASERLDWDDSSRCMGLSEAAEKKWMDLRYARINRKNQAYYQAIRDNRS